MAKAPAKKTRPPEPLKPGQVVLPPGFFNLEKFWNDVDRITIGDGLEKLSNRSRQAILDGGQVSITPYAILALVTSFQSLVQAHPNAEAALQSISYQGIKRKAEDDALDAAAAKNNRRRA